MKVNVACAQFAIGRPANFDDHAQRVSCAVGEMASAGANVVVLPEYLTLELAASFAPEIRGDFVASLHALQAFHDDHVALAQQLAIRHGIYLVAGSFLVEVGQRRYRNRSYLAAPDGQVAWQEKLCMTGFEREAGVIDRGDALRVFDTAFGRLGISICYDNEFPQFARAQAEAGTRLILAPSCTDTEAGAHRVRYGCQARAMENQIYIACAVTAGIADWSPALDVNTGRAAIYTPVDRGFPDDGVLVRGALQDRFVLRELDLAVLEAHRLEGQVGIRADWPDQFRPGVARAVVQPLMG